MPQSNELGREYSGQICAALDADDLSAGVGRADPLLGCCDPLDASRPADHVPESLVRHQVLGELHATRVLLLGVAGRCNFKTGGQTGESGLDLDDLLVRLLGGIAHRRPHHIDGCGQIALLTVLVEDGIVELVPVAIEILVLVLVLHDVGELLAGRPHHRSRGDGREIGIADNAGGQLGELGELRERLMQRRNPARALRLIELGGLVVQSREDLGAESVGRRVCERPNAGDGVRVVLLLDQALLDDLGGLQDRVAYGLAAVTSDLKQQALPLAGVVGELGVGAGLGGLAFRGHRTLSVGRSMVHNDWVHHNPDATDDRRRGSTSRSGGGTSIRGRSARAWRRSSASTRGHGSSG